MKYLEHFTFTVEISCSVTQVEEVKTEVEFFNNYILEPDRPALPEEKPQPPVNQVRERERENERIRERMRERWDRWT